MGRSAKQFGAEYRGHGIQLADLQWSGGSVNYAANRAAGRPGAAAVRESGDGSSSLAPARQSVRDHRNGRRPSAGIHLVSGEHRAGGSSASAGGGVRSEISRRVDDSLPPAAPHDELDDGFAGRQADHDLRSNGNDRSSANANAPDAQRIPTPASVSGVAGRRKSPRLSSGRFHGNGHGRTGAKAGN